MSEFFVCLHIFRASFWPICTKNERFCDAGALLGLYKGRVNECLVDLNIKSLEAPPGFEPGIKVLQTSALPLGHGATATKPEDLAIAGPTSQV